MPNWRSLLFVPVTAERFVAKAHTRGADVIILDLEDSIPPPEKDVARAALPAAAAVVGQGGAEIAVRINRQLEIAIPDIAAAVMPQVTALMLPKVMGPEHIKLLSEVVGAREAALGLPIGRTRFIALVETPQALPNLYAIAAADPRMAAMAVGSEDLSTELEAVPGADLMYHFGMMLVAATRAAGILPLGAVGAFADFNDLDGYRAALKRSRKLGFACTVLHPSAACADHQRGIRRGAGRGRPRPPADRHLRGGAGQGRRRRRLRGRDDRPAGGGTRAPAAGTGALKEEMSMDATHDPKRRSFVASANGHADFPIQNLPLGIFNPQGGEARGGVAIGDSILDLARRRRIC